MRERHGDKKTKMINKIIEAINNNSEVITGGFFAFLIAVLTRKGDLMDRIAGGVLCALFSTGLYFGILSVFPTMPAYSAVAIGSFVGFVGVDECKRIILDKVKSFVQTRKKDEE